MNIRIGNDIRIRMTLSNKIDMVNIKQLRCYLINTSAEGCGYCHDRCKIRHRFPREPFPQFYTPSRYTLNVCGEPRYHAVPWNMKRHYSNFGGPFHDYHWWPEYHGFGLKPGKFAADPAQGCFCEVGGCNHCCDCDHKFLLPSKLLAGKNQIECYFKAKDQIMCGDYKLVVSVTVYEPGWGCDNLHTFTIDKGVIFTLSPDSGSFGFPIDINLDQRDEFLGGYVGFSSAATMQQLEDEDLNEVDSLFSVPLSLTNETSGQYLWIKSPAEIASIYTYPAVYDVPYMFAGESDDGLWRYYRSTNKIINTDFDIVVYQGSDSSVSPIFTISSDDIDSTITKGEYYIEGGEYNGESLLVKYSDVEQRQQYYFASVIQERRALNGVVYARTKEWGPGYSDIFDPTDTENWPNASGMWSEWQLK